MPPHNSHKADLCVVGGAGHVGLPLAIVFASRKQRVLIYDINTSALKLIAGGIMPFMEQGAEPLLNAVLAEGMLSVTSNPADLAGIPALIITVGTGIDAFLSPSMKELETCLDQCLPYLSDDQFIVLRSTVSPGTTEWLGQHLASKGKYPTLAFCPERIVQGDAIEEIQRIPQIISGTSVEAEDQAARLFALVAPETVRLRPIEAELAKLFCNAYRYIHFAVTNQFYMIANSAGLDYYRLLNGMKQNYPRMQDLPRAGFSAGPCLFKDTMQLSAFYENEFSLGYTAMLVNEGLPLYLIQQLEKRYDLSPLTVGLLGMAFKADIDDPRASLSYKLKQALRIRAKRVLTTDPYVNDPELLPAEEAIAESDILILCIPHRVYQQLDLQDKPVVDVWNFFGKGGLIAPGPVHAARRRAKPISVSSSV